MSRISSNISWDHSHRDSLVCFSIHLLLSRAPHVHRYCFQELAEISSHARSTTAAQIRRLPPRRPASEQFRQLITAAGTRRLLLWAEDHQGLPLYPSQRTSPGLFRHQWSLRSPAAHAMIFWDLRRGLFTRPTEPSHSSRDLLGAEEEAVDDAAHVREGVKLFLPLRP